MVNVGIIGRSWYTQKLLQTQATTPIPLTVKIGTTQLCVHYLQLILLESSDNITIKKNHQK